MEWFWYPLRQSKEDQRGSALAWSRITYKWKIIKNHFVASLEIRILSPATSEIRRESGHLGVYSHLQPISKFGPQTNPEVWKRLKPVVPNSILLLPVEP